MSDAMLFWDVDTSHRVLSWDWQLI